VTDAKREKKASKQRGLNWEKKGTGDADQEKSEAINLGPIKENKTERKEKVAALDK